ncbi:MAG: ATP phosphoribosyltransferase [Oscillospiraceae bacterium]
MKPLVIALTKGRLEKDTIKLFDKLGIDSTALKEKGRKLILPIDNGKIEVVLAKAPDVITYIQNGVCDIGIVGKDTIMEFGGSYYELLDLKLGICKFAVAAKCNSSIYDGHNLKTIASKYPNVARTFFASKNMDIDVIKIEGSVELAPLLGLSDAIVDIVETGTTLKENGLEVIEDVAPISARLIVNIASMKLRKNEIDEFVTKLASVI